MLILTAAAFLVNAAGTFTLLEVNPQHGHTLSSPFNSFNDSSRTIYGAGELSNITELNGSLYFVAHDSVSNDELWTSDGTQQGTHLVKDINPTGSAQIGDVFKVGNKLVFLATDGSNWGSFDLFTSDGSESGTQKIADLNLNWNLALEGSVVIGDKLYFNTATDLMCTDGTATGTNSVISLQGCSLQPNNFCSFNGATYFVMGGATGRSEIWTTDGTVSGTQRFIDFSTDTIHNIWSVSNMLVFDNKLFIAASGNGTGLFSIGNNRELIPVTLPGSNLANMSYPGSLIVENDQLFFTDYNGNFSNMYLYHMRAGGTAPEIVPSAVNAPVNTNNGLSIYNNSIYYVGDNPQQIHSINLSTLAHSEIDLPNHSIPNYGSLKGFLVGTGGKIFFPAYETATGKQVLLESDGSTAGTHPIMPADANTDHPFNFIGGCGTQDIFDLKLWGNKVVLPANFNDAGRELWIYEAEDMASGIPTVANDSKVHIFPNPVSKELNFTIANLTGEQTSVRITDMKGQLVGQKTVKGEASSMDVSDLAAGNYLITFLSDSKVTTAKKFVVVK